MTFIAGGEQGRQESMTENTQPPTDNLDVEVNEDANELNNIGKILYRPNIIWFCNVLTWFDMLYKVS